jgi:hypothetical protein
MNNFNDSHSLIIDFPIDLNKFPLVKNCKFHKIELNPGEYIVIPKLWFHWVFTEKNTIAVNYEIIDIQFNDINNDFYNSFNKSIPFTKLVEKININYHDFIKKSGNFTYNAIISKTNDCSPVIKNNLIKYFYNNTLTKLNSLANLNKYYIYIGSNNIESNNILNEYNNIDFILNKNIYKSLQYKTNVWFTLNNSIQSGLHHDPFDNIIYVIDGKKTIYLFSPENKSNLYITYFPLITSIN